MPVMTSELGAMRIRMSLETTVGTISEKHNLEFNVAYDMPIEFIERCIDSGAKALKRASEDTKK
jgi:hypothetical protein